MARRSKRGTPLDDADDADDADEKVSTAGGGGLLSDEGEEEEGEGDAISIPPLDDPFDDSFDDMDIEGGVYDVDIDGDDGTGGNDDEMVLAAMMHLLSGGTGGHGGGTGGNDGDAGSADNAGTGSIGGIGGIGGDGGKEAKTGAATSPSTPTHAWHHTVNGAEHAEDDAEEDSLDGEDGEDGENGEDGDDGDDGGGGASGDGKDVDGEEVEAALAPVGDGGWFHAPSEVLLAAHAAGVARIEGGNADERANVNGQVPVNDTPVLSQRVQEANMSVDEVGEAPGARPPPPPQQEEGPHL